MKSEPTKSICFAVCLNNEGYKASLEVGKIYQVLSDDDAKANRLIRIIDESGKDYAFSEDRFYPIDLPKSVEEVLLAAC
jgi:hypothetical protein